MKERSHNDCSQSKRRSLKRPRLTHFVTRFASVEMVKRVRFKRECFGRVRSTRTSPEPSARVRTEAHGLGLRIPAATLCPARAWVSPPTSWVPTPILVGVPHGVMGHGWYIGLAASTGGTRSLVLVVPAMRVCLYIYMPSRAHHYGFSIMAAVEMNNSGILLNEKTLFVYII